MVSVHNVLHAEKGGVQAREVAVDIDVNVKVVDNAAAAAWVGDSGFRAQGLGVRV